MKEYLLWLDIETTGLDPLKNEIIELAYVLTDFSLKQIYNENHYIIKPLTTYESMLNNIDSWSLRNHTSNGLLLKSKTSEISIFDVEKDIIYQLNKIVTNNSLIYLAGNSVHFDKLFINHYMKNLSNKLSHRILDVSSFAIVCKNIKGGVYDKRPFKKYKHTALSDIWESINEYAYYIENFLNMT